MDDSGHHLAFDFNKNDAKVYAVHSSDLDWDEVKLIANSFLELCKGKTRIEQTLYS